MGDWFWVWGSLCEQTSLSGTKGTRCLHSVIWKVRDKVFKKSTLILSKNELSEQFSFHFFHSFFILWYKIHSKSDSWRKNCHEYSDLRITVWWKTKTNLKKQSKPTLEIQHLGFLNLKSCVFTKVMPRLCLWHCWSNPEYQQNQPKQPENTSEFLHVCDKGTWLQCVASVFVCVCACHRYQNVVACVNIHVCTSYADVLECVVYKMFIIDIAPNTVPRVLGHCRGLWVSQGQG